MVLPVPLAPANSALMPRPRAPLDANPQFSYTLARCRTCAANLTQGLKLPFRQDEIIPVSHGLDALREVIQARACVNATGIPQHV